MRDFLLVSEKSQKFLRILLGFPLLPLLPFWHSAHAIARKSVVLRWEERVQTFVLARREMNVSEVNVGAL